MVWYRLAHERITTLASTDEWHLGRHHGHELNVGLEREAGHVQDSSGHVPELHARLDRDLPVRLRYASHHALRHLGGGVADVDPPAGGLVLRAVQRRRAGPPRGL